MIQYLNGWSKYSIITDLVIATLNSETLYYEPLSTGTLSDRFDFCTSWHHTTFDLCDVIVSGLSDNPLLMEPKYEYLFLYWN